jgi:hypothetical protein
MARRLREFYDHGKRWCLLDTVTLTESHATLQHASQSMEFWIKSFARIARDAGLSREVSRRRAEEGVAAIQGGLVVARVLKSRKPFLNALAKLHEKLTAPSKR